VLPRTAFATQRRGARQTSGRRRLWAGALGVWALLAVLAASAWSAETLAVGSAAPAFRLPGVDGKTWSLDDFASAKVLVIVFTCNHCPTAQAYEERIKQLVADYKGRGVAVAAISPNDPKAIRLDELGYTDLSDGLEEMKIRAKDKAFNFPYLYDGDRQEVSRAYGPAATPHVFIFDRDRRLRFTGRIDNSENPQKATSHETRDAIDALLAGRPVAVERTRVFGCSTKWSDKRQSAKKSLQEWDQEEVTLSVIGLDEVRKLAKNDTQGLRLITVWATWCIPCVAELPDFVAMNRMYRHRGFELVTIAANSPEEKADALRVLKEKHVAAANYLAQVDDKGKLMEAVDPQSPGSVPYTLLIAPGGKVLYRKAGPCEPLEIRKAIVGFLGRVYK
jgi:peroxiredoxin